MILLAPDKFRRSFSASRVCALLDEGIRSADPAALVRRAPMADGGEGTLEAMLSSRGGARVGVRVAGPLGDPVEAIYGVTPEGAAVIESALVCGLQLLDPDRLDPMAASSFGLGETIASALDAGVRRFLIGLGGTATTDGGAGMARALGFRFLDASGRDLSGSGGSLEALRTIDATMSHPDLASARFTALCDVENPLLGRHGAAAVYAPQKGADAAGVARLERGLARLAKVACGLVELDADALAGAPRAGAAGGLGLGCLVFLRAELASGANYLMDAMGLADTLEACDLLVTAEGSLDSQSRSGKVVGALLAKAAAGDRPAIVVAGRWDGSLPEPAPRRLRVLTGADLPHRPDWLSERDLRQIGALIGRSGPPT